MLILGKASSKDTSLQRKRYKTHMKITLPPKPFYFIRHGETEWNKHNIVMGSLDIPLNELGLAQALDASRMLEKESFDIIISSPRIRAQQTAEIIAKKTQKPVTFEPNLTERVWGEAEGKPVDHTKSLFDDAHTPKGAETFTAFQQRILQTVASLLLKNELPLLVSHGGVFKALTHYFGYEGMSSSNCMPFFFKPPEEFTDCWLVYPLKEEEPNAG